MSLERRVRGIPRRSWKGPIIPAVPPFSYCGQCAGHPKWPCPEVADILAALTGTETDHG
jgi:hypothetical protein